jgi:hypothetical protein
MQLDRAMPPANHKVGVRHGQRHLPGRIGSGAVAGFPHGWRAKKRPAAPPVGLPDTWRVRPKIRNADSPSEPSLSLGARTSPGHVQAGQSRDPERLATQRDDLFAAGILEHDLVFAREPADGLQDYVARRFDIFGQLGERERTVFVELVPDQTGGIADLVQAGMLSRCHIRLLLTELRF